MENNFLVFRFSLDSVISSPECKLFLKLSKAIQYASVDQNRKVFASEISKGYRKYIVIDLESVVARIITNQLSPKRCRFQ